MWATGQQAHRYGDRCATVTVPRSRHRRTPERPGRLGELGPRRGRGAARSPVCSATRSGSSCCTARTSWGRTTPRATSTRSATPRKSGSKWPTSPWCDTTRSPRAARSHSGRWWSGTRKPTARGCRTPVIGIPRVGFAVAASCGMLFGRLFGCPLPGLRRPLNRNKLLRSREVAGPAVTIIPAWHLPL